MRVALGIPLSASSGIYPFLEQTNNDSLDIPYFDMSDSRTAPIVRSAF